MPAMQTFDHVFVLMLENHSFDHLLGFSNISGTDAVTGKVRTIEPPDATNPYAGQNWPVTTPAVNPMRVDPGHGFTDTLTQLCGPGATYPRGGPYPPIVSDGFAASFAGQPGFTGSGATPGDPLRCYSSAQVPVLTALAKEFTLCDAWFSAMPGPTWPNRFFVHAASSGGLDHTPDKLEIGLFEGLGFPFEKGHIFQSLDARGLPHRVYCGDVGAMVMSLQGTDRWVFDGEIRWFSELAADVRSGYEPVYTFIEPSYGRFWSDFACGTSQHPVDDVARGEWLIKCTYEAIRNSPIWPNSVLIVTWDEHGGFYDRVAPGPATPPGDVDVLPELNASGFSYDNYGVRVPAVVVSPWMRRNVLDGRTYDHTSILRTVQSVHGLPTLTNRDAAAIDLTSLATLNAPRDTPARLPMPAAQAPGCSPITACGAVPTPEEALALLTEGPAPAEPLDRPHAAFLYSVHRYDLALSAPDEVADRRARAAAVQTKEDLRQYALDVTRRAVAAR